LGIGPGSAIKVIDRYGEQETGWFIEELKKQNREEVIINDLRMVNNKVVANSIGTKKGNANYTRWRRDLIRELEEIRTVKTVFEKLKTDTQKGTVFSTLKQFSRS